MTTPLLLVAVLGVTLASCAGPGEPEEPAVSDPLGTTWHLESGTSEGEPIPILDSHPITLSFTEDGAGGTAACNGYGGSYSISGDTITFSELFQTEMACFPEETMESERRYLEALTRVETISVTEETLTLSGEDTELTLAKLPPIPTSELTGTVWVLDGLVTGDAVSSVSGERATLELFSDGSVVGSTGCRTLNGRYVISGAQVDLNELAAEGDCPAELQEQDNLVVSVLGDGFGVAIEGDTLTITSIGNEGLIYKAG
jgi:heat shock protein HslJ